MTNRKSHTRFRLVPKSSTFDDLERPLCTVSKHMRLSEPTTKNWIKIYLYYRRRRCSPMTLVSDNIRFMRIFAGGPWRGALNNRGVIENVDFQAFECYIFGTLGNEVSFIIWCYLVPCRLSTDPQNTWPWMTLNGHFTLNVHYYELPLSNYLLLIYCRVCLHLGLHMRPAEKCGKRSSGLWSAEYLESAEKLRIFRRNLNK